MTLEELYLHLDGDDPLTPTQASDALAAVTAITDDAELHAFLTRMTRRSKPWTSADLNTQWARMPAFEPLIKRMQGLVTHDPGGNFITSDVSAFLAHQRQLATSAVAEVIQWLEGPMTDLKRAYLVGRMDNIGRWLTLAFDQLDQAISPSFVEALIKGP